MKTDRINIRASQSTKNKVKKIMQRTGRSEGSIIEKLIDAYDYVYDTDKKYSIDLNNLIKLFRIEK